MFDTQDATSNVDQEVNENEIDDIQEGVDSVDEGVGAADVAESSGPKSLDESLAEALKQHSADADKKADPTNAPEVTKPVVSPELKKGQAFDSVNDRVLEPIKAPGSLTLLLKEGWNNVPREFQQFWSDRERHMSKTLQETATARKGWGEFSEIVKPFESQLAQAGMTTTGYTKELFNTAHVLWNGTPQAKADIIYNLLQMHQPDASRLQALLSGQAQPLAQAGHAVNQGQQSHQPVNVRAEVEAMIAEREAAQVEATANEAISDFASNPEHEFYEDVRGWMSELVSSGRVQGGSIQETLKKAYDFATKNTPEIAQILAQREAARAPVQAPVVQRQQVRPNRQVKPGLAAGRSSATTASKPKIKSVDDAFDAAFAQFNAS